MLEAHEAGELGRYGSEFWFCHLLSVQPWVQVTSLSQRGMPLSGN